MVSAQPETEARPNEAVAGAPSVPSREFLSRIPHEYARRHLILSEGMQEVENDHPAEFLAVSARTPPTAIFNVGVRLGRSARTRVLADEDLAIAIDAAYARAQEEASEAVSVEADAQLVAGVRGGESSTQPLVLDGASDLDGEVERALREVESDVLSTEGKAHTVRLVDLILFEALVRGASDVHVQPLRGRTLVRYRLDGVLHTARELPLSVAAAVVSRVKVMARLDVAEQRAPQDGRASISIGSRAGERGTGHGIKRSGEGGGRRVDLRISTLPSTYGERLVIRLLDPARSPHTLSFSALGMPSEIERAYTAQVSRTSGIVLSTGPTGSGKTTTLYTTLAWISVANTKQQAQGTGHREETVLPRARMGGCELNMMTIEDPVEYDLSSGGGGGGSAGGVGYRGDGGTNGGVGLSVSQTQVDPKKSLTFVTGLRHILRQDPDVIMVGEIRDTETARIAVQASLTGHLVLSTLHTNDAASAVARLIDLGVEPFLVASSLSAVLAQRLVRRVHAECHGKGCPECLGTGHHGRTGVFELLVLDAGLRELVHERRPATELKAAAQARGMRTLLEAGRDLIAAGITTPRELARVLEAVDEEELGAPASALSEGSRGDP